MKTNFVHNALIGMGFGFPITVLCMILFGGYNEAVSQFLVWMAASALYGLLSGGMYDCRIDLPLPATLGLHCLGCLLITFGAALLCGYVTDIASFLPILLPFAVIYILIYAVCFLLMKHSEKQVNEALQKK